MLGDDPPSTTDAFWSGGSGRSVGGKQKVGGIGGGSLSDDDPTSGIEVFCSGGATRSSPTIVATKLPHSVHLAFSSAHIHWRPLRDNHRRPPSLIPFLTLSTETIPKFGSDMFLLVQVVLLLDFVHGWNDKWVGYDEQFWYVALFVVSLVCYVASFAFSGVLYHFFTPCGQDCGLNTFFITMTLILAFVFAIVALHPAVVHLLIFIVANHR